MKTNVLLSLFVLAITAITCAGILGDAVKHCADEMTHRSQMTLESRSNALLEMFRIRMEAAGAQQDRAEENAHTPSFDGAQ